MVEIEISVLASQCLDRRIDSYTRLVAEIAAWEKRRNAERARVKWMFTTEKARAKLGRAYPKPVVKSDLQLKVAMRQNEPNANPKIMFVAPVQPRYRFRKSPYRRACGAPATRSDWVKRGSRLSRGDAQGAAICVCPCNVRSGRRR
jgi:hypothetical protein